MAFLSKNQEQYNFNALKYAFQFHTIGNTIVGPMQTKNERKRLTDTWNGIDKMDR